MRWRIPKYFPGWFVSGGGGSGGSGTVQTDGVTLQGDGSAGNKIRILQVETQARLTGAGTVASKLDLAGWPITFFQTGLTTATSGTVANQTVVQGFALPYALTFANIVIDVSTPDNTNNCDIGIYNFAGTLIANIGAQTIAGTGLQSFATLQGSQTIPPGLYMLANTSAAAVLVIQRDVDQFSWVRSGTGGVTAGGALAASITPLAVVPVLSLPMFALF